MTEIFQMVPASGKVFWVLALIIAIIVIPAALVGYSLYAARNTQFEVSEAGLRIRGDMYGRMIPAEALRLDAVAFLNALRRAQPA